jgi:hypothetical protein
MFFDVQAFEENPSPCQQNPQEKITGGISYFYVFKIKTPVDKSR